MDMRLTIPLRQMLYLNDLILHQNETSWESVQLKSKLKKVLDASENVSTAPETTTPTKKAPRIKIGSGWQK